MTGFTAPEFSSDKAANIAAKYALPFELAAVLSARGIESGDKLKEFLEKPRSLINYTGHLSAARTIAELISGAVDDGKSVLVYGDYDVDGISAATILHIALKEIRSSANVYLPSRFGEGYGVAEEALIQAKNQGYDMVVTVDCGISAVNEAEKAKELGLDFVITDHHSPPEVLPDAPIVNPLLDAEWLKRTGHNLSGAAVSLAVAAELFRLRGHSIERLYDKTLEFVGLATVADIMELVGVNRALVHHGLEQMWDTGNLGLRAILEAHDLCINVPPTAEQLAFSVIPALNACGRMHSPRIAFKLFTADSRDEARVLASKVRDLNRLRRLVQDRVFDEAARMAVEEGDVPVYVLYSEDWHAGILGIVASKILEIFGKPAIILSAAHGDDGMIRGSARGPQGFDLRNAIENCSGHLERFGGHTMAAGVVLSKEKLGDFKTALLTSISDFGDAPNKSEPVSADAIVDVRSLAELEVEQLERLAPFGQGNPCPKFLLKYVTFINARTIGRDSTTISAIVSDGAAQFRVVGFRKSHLINRIREGARYNAVVSTAVDSYNGVRRVRFGIEDIEPCEKEGV